MVFAPNQRTVVLREEKRVDCRLQRERESEDLMVLIYTRQETTNERTQQKTNERHDESRRLSDKSKETSRTTGNLENSHDRPVLPPRLIESSRMLDHARSLAARVQERNRFPIGSCWYAHRPRNQASWNPLLYRLRVVWDEWGNDVRSQGRGNQSFWYLYVPLTNRVIYCILTDTIQTQADKMSIPTIS
jgi:hypothetical protein